MTIYRTIYTFLVIIDDLKNRPLGFSFTGMDVAAGRDIVVVFLQLGVLDDAAELFLHGDLAFDKKPSPAAGGTVDLHAGFRFEHARHDGADLGRGVKLTGTLPAPFGDPVGELSDDRPD